MAALSGMNSPLVQYLVNRLRQSKHACYNGPVHNEGATIISFESTKKYQLKFTASMSSNYNDKVYSKAVLPTLNKAARTLQHTIAATATRALHSTVGQCLLNGDFLQGFLMLILFLPGVAIAKRRSQDGIPLCGENNTSIGIGASVNKSKDQNQ